MTKMCGLIVNSSRNIIYASNGTDFETRARQEARVMQREMQLLLER
jgi:orotidine-5'-phosphate decarboxylase